MSAISRGDSMYRTAADAAPLLDTRTFADIKKRCPRRRQGSRASPKLNSRQRNFRLWSAPLKAKKRRMGTQNLEMLKCKNEAEKLLKTQENYRAG